MNDSWITRSHQELLKLRGPSPGWGNRREGSAYVEPTCLAALALAASRPASAARMSQEAVRDAADWLARLQQRDGALGIAPDLPQPRWTTALAVLVWSAAAADAARRKAVEWLLSSQGNTWTPQVAEPFGHDPGIAGWPWVEGTHSWLEPTALAVLALSRAGRTNHERTRDGRRLIRDRVIRSGGWNYGNSTVFGADLRPHPAPTGLALLALAETDDADSQIVASGCAYLERILPTTRAPQSLCLGILALTAWGRRPGTADDWLVAAHDGAARRSNSIAELAYLLLAAGPRSLELLGIERPVLSESSSP